MCGIVGYVGAQQVVPVLVDGLRRLEYRGYDSAGVAVVRDGRHRACAAAPASCRDLEDVADRRRRSPATTASATRAGPRTAGRPRRTPTRTATAPAASSSSTTASSRTTSQLQAASCRPRAARSSPTPTPRSSRTSSTRELQNGADARSRPSRRALAQRRAALYALVADVRGRARTRSSPPQTARRSSSASATARTSSPPTSRAHPRAHPRRDLPRGRRDRACSPARASPITDFDGKRVAPASRSASRGTPVQAEKGGYKHFMLKEIHEQPRAVARHAARPRRLEDAGDVFLDEHAISTPRSCAASTASTSSPAAPSWHAALVGKFLIEQLARVPVEVDYGSRVPLPRSDRRPERRWSSRITQSGETADTLAALREAKAQGRAHARDLQRGRQRRSPRAADGARLHARRPRDRRRLDQGVHDAARRAAPARALPRRGARHARRASRARELLEALRAAAAADRATSLDARRRRSRSIAQRYHRRAATSSSSAAASTTRSRSRARSSSRRSRTSTPRATPPAR